MFLKPASVWIEYLACRADLGSSDINPVFIKAIWFQQWEPSHSFVFAFFCVTATFGKSVGPSETGFKHTGRRRSD